ncbi:phosphatase PAP2 family protein [Craterilacuibacter sinensis]|uniref:Phosphatase PAP2 family protein n=1 Tax=Craterilacuibacter sinensis TaxID=2686017 RepID=A0A845BN38_9NEIS|nr:phosphatase PAP2 family protein [Craterilacuibacter sinensis]MXR37679.1 phosphatase PAP2 family protein [Craterilacuibacter sinensis]
MSAEILPMPVAVAAGDKRAFYQMQGMVLASLALLFWVLNRFTGLDLWLAGLAYDPASGGFALKNSVWLDWINHRLAKYAVIAIALCWLVQGVRRRDGHMLTTGMAMALATLAVSLLKAASPHSCPWSLTQFGGSAELFTIFGEISAHPGPGRCFPGGHASGGFALMAGYLFYRESNRVRARSWLAAGLLAGALMGAGQMVRGAHFLSHNLWSGWVVWLVCVVVFALYDGLRAHRQKKSFGLSLG